MNRLELRMGGLAILLRSQDLLLDQLAEQFAAFLGTGEASYDLVVDLELATPSSRASAGSNANGSRLILERQLQRKYGQLPDSKRLLQRRLEEGSRFLSHPAFAESLRMCERRREEYQLVQVSNSGTWFLDRDATRARVFAMEGGDEYGIPPLDSYYRHLLSWVLARRRGVLLHAAAVADGSSAYLFVGPSGSGKTTIARAARERGWSILADDGLIVRDMGPGRLCAFRSPWYANMTPWTGDFGSNSESARIQAVFFIEPGPSDQLVRLGHVSGTARLVRAAYPTLRFLEPADSARVFGLLVRLSQDLPSYRLSFTVDCAFLEQIKTEL